MTDTINPLIAEREPEIITTAKKFYTLEELKKQAYDIKNKCTDFEVTSSKHNVRIMPNLDVAFYTGTTKHVHKLSPYAFGQLCTKAGVPTSYMKKCISKGKYELVEDNLNEWIETNNKDLLFRIYDNKVRGIVSDKYSTFDTADVVDTLIETFGDEYKVKSFLLNEERFHARLIDPSLLPSQKEDLYPGFEVDTSDVGRLNLGAQFFIFKLVCTNGLSRVEDDWKLFEQKHIGITSQKFQQYLAASLEAVPEIAAEAVERIKASKSDILNEEQVLDLLEDFRKKADLSGAAQDKIIELVGKYEPSRWGVINAITDAAKDYTLDRRLQLEKHAGQLLLVA